MAFAVPDQAAVPATRLVGWLAITTVSAGLLIAHLHGQGDFRLPVLLAAGVLFYGWPLRPAEKGAPASSHPSGRWPMAGPPVLVVVASLASLILKHDGQEVAAGATLVITALWLVYSGGVWWLWKNARKSRSAEAAPGHF